MGSIVGGSEIRASENRGLAMSDLVQIKNNNGYHWRKMKVGGDRFQAKKTEGGLYYWLVLPGGIHSRHLANVVEKLSEVDNENHD